jgi:co-chaperonin GroES (HSP10)
MPAVAMLHEIDPREVILKKVGSLENIEVFGNDILVAIYKRPEKTKSGLILTANTLNEDIHQGKVGLVLKMGPTSYLDDDGNKFRDIKEGDWVVFRPSDGWRVTLNTLQGTYSKDDTVDCRIVSDISIRSRVSDPDLIY